MRKQKFQNSWRLFAIVLVALFGISATQVFAQAAASETWTPVDVGAPSLGGSAQELPCGAPRRCPVLSISGAGRGLARASDEFTFAYQKLTGDGIVTLRLLSRVGPSQMEVGLMMRESLSASAPHVAILTSHAGATVQSRTAAGRRTSSAVPRRGWLRLERVGSTVTASVSGNGTTWRIVKTRTLRPRPTVYVGIVISSREASTLANATVSNMSVTSTSPMPEGWASADVGPARRAGTASYSSGSFTATSTGAGLANDHDAFRFIYARVRGDATLTTRVVASEGQRGRQAGIALRTALHADAATTALVADDAGLLLIRRDTKGEAASTERVATTAGPVYLRLHREASMVTVSYSTNNVTWKTVTTVDAGFGSDVYAGLGVAAGPSGGTAAAAFDRLSLISVPANAPPVVSLTAPVNGRVVEEGQTVPLAARASDPDGHVARVDFLVNGSKIASDAAAPYAASWMAGAPGVYTIVAVVVDVDGAVTTSSPAVITVTPSAGGDDSPAPPPPAAGPWRLIFTASSDHSSLDRYELSIYNAATRTLVLTRPIGKPAVASDGTCTVDIDALVAALPHGAYDGIVRAVASFGIGASVPYEFDK